MGTAFELKTGDGRSFLIEGDWSRFGRDAENEIVVKDQNCSRHHLNFYIKEDALIVEDAGSTNGFLVNGSKPEGPVYLNPGDKLFVGSTEYFISRFGEEAPAPPPPRPTSGTISSQTVYRSDPAPMPASNRLKVYAALGVVIVLFAFLGRKQEEPKREPANVDVDKITKSLASEGYRGEARRQRSITEVRSQGKFHEGLRDYNNGNYSRSLLSFKEALTLEPSNQDSRNYIENAEMKILFQIEGLLKGGQRSFTTMQYRRSKSEMAQLLTVLGDQIIGYGRKIAQETVAKNEIQRSPGQEAILLQIPCEKVPEFAPPKQGDLAREYGKMELPSTRRICKEALDLLRQARAALGDDDVIREEGALK